MIVAKHTEYSSEKNQEQTDLISDYNSNKVIQQLYQKTQKKKFDLYSKYNCAENVFEKMLIYNANIILVRLPYKCCGKSKKENHLKAKYRVNMSIL
jgi:hypothetical protein